MKDDMGVEVIVNAFTGRRGARIVLGHPHTILARKDCGFNVGTETRYYGCGVV
jgi:hypothetical protein